MPGSVATIATASASNKALHGGQRPRQAKQEHAWHEDDRRAHEDSRNGDEKKQRQEIEPPFLRASEKRRTDPDGADTHGRKRCLNPSSHQCVPFCPPNELALSGRAGTTARAAATLAARSAAAAC